MVTRDDLEKIWTEATGLEADTPLHATIIAEALEGGGCEGNDVAETEDVILSLTRIIEDIATFVRYIGLSRKV